MDGDASAVLRLLDHAPVDLFHEVVRKLPQQTRVAFRAASRSTRALSDAATEALTITKPYLLTADLADRFPNVKSLTVSLVNESDTVSARSLDALTALCPRLLARLHALTLSFTGEWTVFAAKLFHLLQLCTSLTSVALHQSFCNNNVLRHNWTATFDLAPPAALPTLRALLTQRTGIHKASGTPAWTSLLTALTVHHIMVIPHDPIAPYILPTPAAATALRALTLHTNADTVSHFLTSSLSQLALLTALDMLLELPSSNPPPPQPHWHTLARLHALATLSIRFLPAPDKDPAPPAAADPFPIPHKWSRLTSLHSLTVAAPCIHDLSALAPMTTLRHLSLSAIAGPHPPLLPHLPLLRTLTLTHAADPTPPAPAPTPQCPHPSSSNGSSPPASPPASLASQLFACFRPRPTAAGVDPLPPFPPCPPSAPVLSPLPCPELTNASFNNFPPVHLPSWPDLTTLRTLTLTLTHHAATPAALPPIAALSLLQTLHLHNAELSPALFHTLSTLPALHTLSLHSALLLPLRTPAVLPALASLALHSPLDPPSRTFLPTPNSTSPLDHLLLNLNAPALTSLRLLTPTPLNALAASTPATYTPPKPCHYASLLALLAAAPLLSPDCITGLPTLLTSPAHLHHLATTHPSFLAHNPIAPSSLSAHLGPAAAAAAATGQPLTALHLLGVLPGYPLRAATVPPHGPHLTALHLSMAAMLPSEVTAALAAAPNLRSLVLHHSTLLTPKSLAHIAASCPRLTHLHLDASRLRPKSLAPINSLHHLRSLVLQRYAGSAQLLAVVAVLHPQLRPQGLELVAFTGALTSVCDVDWFVSAMPISGMLWAVDRVRIVKAGPKHQDILFEMTKAGGAFA